MKYRKWHMQMSAGPLGEFTVSAPQHCPPLHSQIPLVSPWLPLAPGASGSWPMKLMRNGGHG